MNLAIRAALAAILSVAALFPALTMAQVSSKNQGYLIWGANSDVVTSGFGLCWRTSDWTPARAAAAEAGKRCDPDLAPKPAAAPAATPAAKPTPTPKPAPKPEPAKLLPQKINFSADALFDFDRADVKPEGKAMLDDLVRVLQGAKYEVILAIGHTDRIGTAAYNQKLSVRRAGAVKQYLVGKGIAPNRIHAEGKGKTQPLTKPADCKMKNRKALIACLQPDRRVDVEVTGTK
jgi:OOP family OmpA-OmpF porin